MKAYFIQAAISLAVAIITLFGGYLIYGPKLRKEQKSEFQKDVGKKKAKALTDFKEIIAEFDTFEAYSFENQAGGQVTLHVRELNTAIYPAFMNSRDDLFKMIDKVSALRKDEMYLDQEAGAYLLYIYKYLFELANFASVKYPNTDFPTLGVVFIIDIQRWTEAADRVVIRDINDARVTLESHKGEQWEIVRDQVYSSLYDKSLLHLLQMNPEDLDDNQRQQYDMATYIFESYKVEP